jgi:hypothetical protein
MLLFCVAIGLLGLLCVFSDDVFIDGGIYASRALPSMPRVGFGTAAMGQWTVESVCHALRHGFKLIDTAQAPEWYSEELLGDALRQCWGHRSVNELVIVTKVPQQSLHPYPYPPTHSRAHTHHSASWAGYQTRSLLCWPPLTTALFSLFIHITQKGPPPLVPP